jgi:hypothetical protein
MTKNVCKREPRLRESSGGQAGTFYPQKSEIASAPAVLRNDKNVSFFVVHKREPGTLESVSQAPFACSSPT